MKFTRLFYIKDDFLYSMELHGDGVNDKPFWDYYGTPNKSWSGVNSAPSLCLYDEDFEIYYSNSDQMIYVNFVNNSEGESFSFSVYNKDPYINDIGKNEMDGLEFITDVKSAVVEIINNSNDIPYIREMQVALEKLWVYYNGLPNKNE